MLRDMGVRLRRSIRIAPGIRLNVTKTGIGVTTGGKVARYSVHSSGRRTVGLGLPGTGTYYQETSSGSGRARSRINPGPASQPAGPIEIARHVPKPGFLASGTERAYHAGLLAYLSGDQATALTNFETVVASDRSATSAHLFAGIAATALDDAPRALAHLEAVVGSPTVLPDHLQSKYVPPATFDLALNVPITHAISVRAPFGNLAAVLALTEAYQSAGRLEEAIGLMQQVHQVLPDDALVRLSLCDLLLADGDHDGVIELSAGVANDSDANVETIHIRGAAFAAKGLTQAALDAFSAALSKTANRDSGLLNSVRYDRVLLLEHLGQSKRARIDLERIYASNPSFEDVKTRLGI